MYKKLAALAFVGLLASATANAASTIDFGTSTVGTCCFAVTATDVAGGVQVTAVTVPSTNFFVDSGNATGNHPGFAFNLNTNTAITLTFNSTLSPDWVGESLLTNAVTNGPDLGTFQYWFMNPISGANDPSPIVFTILGSGIDVNSFTTNAAGFYFAADVQNSQGATGEAGLNGTPVVTATPEPSSLMLLGTGIVGAAGLIRRRIAA